MALLEQIPVPVALLYSVAAAAVLIYVPFLVVLYGRVQVGYDVAAPRALFDKLPAYAQRATWAHQNSFEAFMLFAVATLIAYVTEVSAEAAVGAAIAHVVARFFYSIFYIVNVPLGRSLMFGIGSTGTSILFVLGLIQVNQ